MLTWLPILALAAPALSLKLDRISPGAVTNSYYWPSARGKVGSYGVSEYRAPKNFKDDLAWSWHHELGRFHTVLFGTAVDDKSNIYLTCAEGLRKFSPNGDLVWEYKRGAPGYTLQGEITTSASLFDGMMYSSTTECELFAVDMATGAEVWKTKVSENCGGDSGFTSVDDSVVISAGDASTDNLKWTVKGFSAQNGSQLWSFGTEGPTWTFSPNFAGDGTFTFQDAEGRVYRNRVRDGGRVWVSGGNKDSWTDGQSLLGSNGIVYAVGNRAGVTSETMDKDTHGNFCAYAFADGKQLWCAETPRPPNGVASLGAVAGHDGSVAVLPIGRQVEQGAPTDVIAYDARTGRQVWIFDGPTQQGIYQRAEVEGYLERKAAGVRAMTLPHPWSAPTIDSDGTVIIGSEEGQLFALRDENSDGVVSGAGEVGSFDALACFHGDSSPAITPDLMAVSTTDTLYVFKRASQPV